MVPGIEAVVFDIGGVLVPSPLDEFAKVDAEHGLAEGTAMSHFRGGSLFAQCEIGTLGFSDFCLGAVTSIEADQGIAVPWQRLEAMMAAIMGDTVDTDMLALVAEIKSIGLVTGLCTNIFAEREAWVREKFPADLIDVYCESWAVGQRKPDPAIYRTLVAMLGCRPDEIVFVDDFDENVAAAAGEGIRGVLFSGEAQLRGELVALGVEVTPAAA